MRRGRAREEGVRRVARDARDGGGLRGEAHVGGQRGRGVGGVLGRLLRPGTVARRGVAGVFGDTDV